MMIDIEYLHEAEKMPNFAYYQLNGKDIQKNYAEQRKRIHNDIEAQTYQEIESILSDLLKDF